MHSDSIEAIPKHKSLSLQQMLSKLNIHLTIVIHNHLVIQNLCNNFKDKTITIILQPFLQNSLGQLTPETIKHLNSQCLHFFFLQDNTGKLEQKNYWTH